MDQEPPVNYVAGLGRGATGFTTRSDIGPARNLSGPDVAPITPTKNKEEEDDDKGDYSESNYDEFEGYGGSLYDPNAVYDQDDKEADEIWASVDKKMDLRRKARREAREKEEIEKYRQVRPKIQSQFADLKKELSKVKTEEWDAIPEIGDHTQRYKKKTKTSFGYLPVPDSLLEKAKNENSFNSTLSLSQQKYGGLETPLTSDGITTPSSDLTQIGAARNLMLGLNLKKIEDSVEGQTVVDPKGYLTDLGK